MFRRIIYDIKFNVYRKDTILSLMFKVKRVLFVLYKLKKAV